MRTAVDAGADAVYCGFQDATNARNFAGLNFDDAQVREGVRYAHARGREVLMALNTYADARDVTPWQRAVDRAAALGADALIVADVAVLAYARDHHPQLRRHLSVQASATTWEAVEFYRERYGIQRAVLPRVLTLQQVQHAIRHTGAEIEVFGFGSLCVMVEGRCLLSSYAAGKSPNTHGVCSPAASVQWIETPNGLETRLGDVLVDRVGAGAHAGYPTLCKGRYQVGGNIYYAIEEPTSLNTLDLLPHLAAAGVAAIKLEGRQRSPAYVRQVTGVWRAAIDSCRRDPAGYRPRAEWQQMLGRVSEGQQTTLGAYARPWQ